jgi:hypothetical protein
MEAVAACPVYGTDAYSSSVLGPVEGSRRGFHAV